MPRKLRQSTFADDRGFTGVTIGIVVDTNDPQQMGRVRAFCAGLNDPRDTIVTDIPWAAYATPFGGTVNAGTRGKDDSAVTGPVAYGMWAIPKLGSQVLIMCIDGNPQTRIWMGCLHTQLATHTMPHGRFTYKDGDPLPDDETPVGPISTVEDIIEPLHTNLRKAFDADHEGDNFEFQSRGADFQVSGIGLGQTATAFSEVEDDDDIATTAFPQKGNNPDGTEFTGSRQGYQTSRFAPTQFTSLTDRNLDNTVTSIVSPGFHGLSMDDRQENCRVRVRTTGGHQIIFDDTNERIYLSTARGENWIEMDEQGNIDIYTSGKISAHAAHDINFTSDRSIRMYGKAGIHLKSGQEVRITAENDISLHTSAALRTKSANNTIFESIKDIHLKATEDLAVTAGSNVDVKSGSELKLDGDSTHLRATTVLEISSGAVTNINGSSVNLNAGGSATEADEADASDAADFLAFFTNRIPEHEPWARVDTDRDDSTDTVAYNSANVGKQRRITAVDGVSDETDDKITNISRGKNWRR